MNQKSEQLFYVTASAGMALATSVFTMMSGMIAAANMLGVLAGILLGGGICCAIALSIGELASMYPSAPGIRTYLKTALGNQPSLFLVYLYLVSVVLIAGLESLIFADVIRTVFPQVPQLIIVLSLILLVLTINLLGFELPRIVQVLTTVAAVSLLLFFSVKGILHPKAELVAQLKAESLLDSFRSIPAATGMAVFIYMGFEWVTPLGFRPTSYRWMVPVSMPVVILLLCVMYSCFVTGLLLQVPRAGIVSTTVPQVLYLKVLFGANGIYWAFALALVTTLSMFNAGIMGGSRLISFLANEGKLPLWCGSISYRTGAPLGSTILLACLTMLSAAIMMTLHAEILVAVVGSCIICAIYSAFMLAVIVLRKRKPGIPRPFHNPMWGWIQSGTMIFLAYIGIQILFAEPELGFGPTAVFALSLAFAWFLTSWYRGLPKGQAMPIAERP